MNAAKRCGNCDSRVRARYGREDGGGMNALDWLLHEFESVTFRRFVNGNVSCTAMAWTAIAHTSEEAAQACYEQIPWKPEERK